MRIENRTNCISGNVVNTVGVQWPFGLKRISRKTGYECKKKKITDLAIFFLSRPILFYVTLIKTRHRATITR